MTSPDVTFPSAACFGLTKEEVSGSLRRQSGAGVCSTLSKLKGMAVVTLLFFRGSGFRELCPPFEQRLRACCLPVFPSALAELAGEFTFELSLSSLSLSSSSAACHALHRSCSSKLITTCNFTVAVSFVCNCSQNVFISNSDS